MRKNNILSLFMVSLVISLMILGIFSYFTVTPAQALTYGIEAEGNFTTFADDEVLRREIELTEEDSLQLAMTSGGGFALGGNVEIEPGLRMIADGGLIMASDSDRTTVEGTAETIEASIMLLNFRLTGEVNLAEFSQMYDLPNLLLTGGIGYYQGFGEITSTAEGFVDEELEGGSIGLRLGTGIREELDENLSLRGNIGARLLEIGFEQHTNLSGLELSGGITYTF